MDLPSHLCRKTWDELRKGVKSSRNRSSSRSSGNRFFYFFRLPLELREKIYTELLTRPYISEMWIQHERIIGIQKWSDITAGPNFLITPKFAFTDTGTTPSLTTSLLLVNRAIYREAARILYGRNTIVLNARLSKIIDFILALTPFTRSVIRSLKLYIDLADASMPCKYIGIPNSRCTSTGIWPRRRFLREIFRSCLRGHACRYGTRNGRTKALMLWCALAEDAAAGRKIYRVVAENDSYDDGSVLCSAHGRARSEWSPESLHTGNNEHDIGWSIIRQMRAVLQQLDFREESVSIAPLKYNTTYSYSCVFMGVRGKNFHPT